jgi:Ca2+/Na+ antiporter
MNSGRRLTWEERRSIRRKCLLVGFLLTLFFLVLGMTALYVWNNLTASFAFLVFAVLFWMYSAWLLNLREG